MLAKIESSKAGYEEAILLDQLGNVCEGTGENLFLVKDGRIATPPFSSSILGGINRLSVIQIARDLGYAVDEREIARGELYMADEIFLTGTAAELDPGARDRRPAGRRRRAGRDHARGPAAPSRTPCTAAPSATRSGSIGRDPGARHVTSVLVYDCTLRDGMQGEAMSLSAEEKVRVVHVLDDLGVHMVEAGFPASNPKEAALFELLAAERFEHAQIAAFGMTRRRGLAADADPALRVLADAFAPVCTRGRQDVGAAPGEGGPGRPRGEPADDRRLRRLPRRPRARRSSTTPSTSSTPTATTPAYALRCLRAAADAGARVDHAVRHQRRVAAARDRRRDRRDGGGAPRRRDRHPLPQRPRVRRGQLARAASGPAPAWCRARSTATASAAATPTSSRSCPNLQLKLGYDCLPALEGLTEASHYVAELLNFVPDPNQAYVGKNAFAHKGGMHVAGVAADPATFEHIDPAVVGNARELLISELSGKGTVLERAAAGGLELDEASAARVVERVKALEHRGFQFEAADGSFDLLIRRETGDFEPLFRLESWRVIAEKREDGKVQTEATIKVWVDGERHVRTAEGNGPVNALDRALREAITESHPHLADIKLVNYKVRILDEFKATGAVTRVLLDASDGVATWGAIGVHENVIEASWDALVDSLEAGMLPGRRHHRRGAAADRQAL